MERISHVRQCNTLLNDACFATISQQIQRWKRCLEKNFTTGTQTWCKLTDCDSIFYLLSEMFLFSFCFSSEKSSTNSCLCSLRFPPTIMCNLVARYIIKVDKMGEPVYIWCLGLPTSCSTHQNTKITNKPAIVVSKHVAGFVALWNQLAAGVSEGSWNNQSVRDSTWPPYQPSVNEQTLHWTCHRRPSEETSNSHRSSFNCRTFRLA